MSVKNKIHHKIQFIPSSNIWQIPTIVFQRKLAPVFEKTFSKRWHTKCHFFNLFGLKLTRNSQRPKKGWVPPISESKCDLDDFFVPMDPVK